MHICFLCGNYPRNGGVGSFTQTLGRALVEKGHAVSVVGVSLTRRELRQDDRGVTVIQVPHTLIPRAGFVFNGVRLRQALFRLHKESPLSVIEGPEPSLATIPSSFPRTKVIRMHGGHHFFSVSLGQKPKVWRGWLEQRSFQRADSLCAVSHYVAGRTRSLLSLNGRPIKILPNPVDVSLFSPKRNVQEKSGLIVFVGTICEKKGVRQLIQAMPDIVAAVPHAQLWLVGPDWRDPQTGASYSKSLQGLIPEELAPHIIFKGPVDHDLLPDVLAQAALCVYPSHMEALPLAWLEGMAMGKSVVASKTGPGPEVIEDEVSGLLCDPYDPNSIADRVIACLKSADLRRRLGLHARQRAIDHFSIDTLVERNEAFYRDCIGQFRCQ